MLPAEDGRVTCFAAIDQHWPGLLLLIWVVKVRIWVRPMMMIYYGEVALTSFDLVLLGFPFYAAAWGVCWLQTVMSRQTNTAFWYCPVFEFYCPVLDSFLPWSFYDLISATNDFMPVLYEFTKIWGQQIFASDVFHVGWIRMQAINFDSCVFSSCLNLILVWLLTRRSHRKWNGGLWQSNHMT
jgi:hypothetical protein